MLPARDPEKPLSSLTPRIATFVRKDPRARNPDFPWTIRIEFDGKLVAGLDMDRAMSRAVLLLNYLPELAEEDYACTLAQQLADNPYFWYDLVDNGNTIVREIEEARQVLAQVREQQNDRLVVARFL